MEEGLAALVNNSPQGKTDECHDDPDDADIGPDIDENKLIARKTNFEHGFILKFSLLGNEFVFAGISIIKIIITFICLTLRRVVDQGSQAFLQDLTSTDI